MTMSLIERQTASTTIAGFTFSSIPATFTDLRILLSVRSNNTGDTKLWFRFNGSTSGYNYGGLVNDGTQIYGTSNGDGTDRFASNGYIIPDVNNDSGIFSNIDIYVCNYAQSVNKSLTMDGVEERFGNPAYDEFSRGFWGNTSAINSIYFWPSGGSFIAGSTVSLYGVLKGSGGATVS